MQKVLIRRIIYIVESIDVFVIDNNDRLNEVRQNKPGIELQNSITDVIKSFYTGIVDLLLVLANNVDGYVPDTHAGNKKLFYQLSKNIDSRDALISEEVMQKLVNYDTVLKKTGKQTDNINWQDLRPLIEEMHIIWSLIKIKTEQLIIELLKTS